MDNDFVVDNFYGRFNFDWRFFQMKISLSDVGFWGFLVLSAVLILWRVFGDSPGEVAVFGAVAGVIFSKVIKNSENFSALKVGVKSGFVAMKNDVGLLKSDMVKVREDLAFIKGRLEK